jgi:hypothetical protein
MIKPLPKIAVLPGYVRMFMMIRPGVKTETANKESFIAIDLQCQPFYGVFDSASVLRITPELNVITSFNHASPSAH